MAWLRERAPGCAEAYETALHLVAREPTTGAGSLVAHCLRDILNRLGETLGGSKAEQVQYRNLTDELGRAIEAARFSTAPPTTGLQEASVTVEMPVSILEPLHRLLTEARRGSDRAQDKERAVFVGILGPRGGDSDLQKERNRLRKVRTWATEKAHFAGSKARAVPWDEALGQVAEMEEILLALRRNFFDQAKEMDAILELANA